MSRNGYAVAAFAVFTLGFTACDDEARPDEGPEYRDDGRSFGNTFRDWLVGQVRTRVAASNAAPTPAAPAVSDEMFALGQALAFDKELSGNRNISCMTCHHPFVGTDDDRSLPAGEGATGLGTARSGGEIIPRNAPALFNLHAFDTMFWDSRVEPASDGGFHTPAGAALTPEMEATLTFGVAAAQALFPVTSREEMRGHGSSNELAALENDNFDGIWSGIMGRLLAIPEYVDLFAAAYPDDAPSDLTFAHAANAIAAFEIRAFEARNSPWERFLAGDDDAMSTAQLLGAKNFFDLGCVNCHDGAGLSDFGHHSTGLPQIGPGKGDGADGHDDFGREKVTGDPGQRYTFRTAVLTNTALTGPWGHDGQFADLGQFLGHYADPEAVLTNYDVSVETNQENLWSLDFTNTAAVIASISAEVTGLAFSSRRWRRRAQLASLEVFLGSLTDPASENLAGFVPTRVPSGLPIGD